MNTQSFDALPATPLHWLWPHYIPRGRITLLLADPGLGKTTLALDLAARLSKNLPLPPNPAPLPNPTLPASPLNATPTPSQPLASLLFSPEDHPADTLLPRLQSMNADLTHIHLPPSDFQSLIPTENLNPIDTLESLTATIPNLALILFDPITHFIPRPARRRRIDSLGPDPRELALRNLADFAQRRSLAILLTLRPLNDFKPDDPHSLRLALGSHSFLSDLRSILLLRPSPDDPPSDSTPQAHSLSDPLSDPDSSFPPQEHNRILIPLRSNLTERPPNLKLLLKHQIHWDSEPTPPELRPTRLARAAEFLQYILQKGPWHAEKILRNAATQNIAAYTLRRAKSALAIHSTHADVSEGWFWSLPDDLRPLPTYEEIHSDENDFRR